MLSGLTSTVSYAALGGLAGSFWASLRDEKRWVQRIIEAVIATIFAAAAAEYCVPPDKLWVNAGTGVLVGLLTRHVLKIVDELAPSALERLIRNILGKLTSAKQD